MAKANSRGRAGALRKARVARKTRETDITVELKLDGSGKGDIRTPIPFLDHMLANFARHGLFDLAVRAKGDIEVDLHHTLEDVGLTLGEALKKALGGHEGIVRCGSSDVPMMDSLATVVLDISNRPYLKFTTTKDSFAVSKKMVSAMLEGRMVDVFDMGLLQEFLKALSNSAGLDLHVTLHYGADIHHAIEAVFKALGRALSAAVAKDRRIRGVMSTKGRL
ncbi:MAG: imidazoleglycerol-phosphate dehydratase HisB [Deltaproteobacteria bacterium]|nr:imidazoleglycerol-phosphate dehydratase HisB [Deltaproteobacteria bacterium]